MQGASAGSRRLGDKRRRRHDTGRRQTSTAAARQGEGARMAAASRGKEREERGKAKKPPSRPGTGEGGRAESRSRGARAVGGRGTDWPDVHERSGFSVTRAIGGDSPFHRGPIRWLDGQRRRPVNQNIFRTDFVSHENSAGTEDTRRRVRRSRPTGRIDGHVLPSATGGLSRPRLPMKRA